jgi:hypothetical protein
MRLKLQALTGARVPIPLTAVSGSFKYGLHSRGCAPFVFISSFLLSVASRRREGKEGKGQTGAAFRCGLELNDPHTAVWGITR